MTLFIGRNPATRDVEVRNYKGGAPVSAGFRTPTQLVERIEELEHILKLMKIQSPKNPLESLFGGFHFPR